MNLRLSLILLLFLAFYTSCKNDKPLIIEDPGFPLLDKVMYGPELSNVYTWNASYLISEEKSKFFYTKHNYNNQNQLVSSDFYVDPGIYSSDSHIAQASMNRTEWVNPDNTAKEMFRTYEYNQNGQLIKYSINRLNTNYKSYSIFEYNAKGQISKETWYSDGKANGNTIYIYNFAGNLILKTRNDILADGSFKLSTTTEYEFDNKKNPYLLFKMQIPGIYTNQNNIIKETYTLWFEVDSFVDKIQITETTYEYNDYGYPVKQNGTVEFVYH
ncbi:MAG TPA: hypothetical protein VFC67_07290 [Prolixibacteraceae bacterium]|nr:hypothetical protein [Prolixibacteraceae bacterium]